MKLQGINFPWVGGKIYYGIEVIERNEKITCDEKRDEQNGFFDEYHILTMGITDKIYDKQCK